MLAEPITAMDSWLQYGALGLIGIMLILNHFDRIRMSKALDRKDAEMLKVSTRAINFIDRCCRLLDERPCLIGHVKAQPGLDAGFSKGPEEGSEEGG